jgi:hypothetical protein
MGAWLPAAFLSMQPWSWWVMMQPASISRQKVSVLTSHSLIAWITIWTYHLDSHLRRCGFVHLLASWLPAWCMLLHFPCHCQHLFSLSHITKFLSWLLRLLVRVFANLVNIATQLSTLPFDAFLVACSLVIFCDFCSQLARAPSTNSQSGYFFMSILVWKNLLLNPTPVFNCTRWWILL